MANGRTHTLVGAGAGLAVALSVRDKHQGEQSPVFGAIMGAFAGKLPDIFEPALNPNHRQFFHSIAFLGAAGYSLKKVYDWEPQDGLQKAIRMLVLCAGAGYISHLLLDATTPKCLPLLGKL